MLSREPAPSGDPAPAKRGARPPRQNPLFDEQEDSQQAPPPATTPPVKKPEPEQEKKTKGRDVLAPKPEDVLRYKEDGSIAIKSMQLLFNLYGKFDTKYGHYEATDSEMVRFA